MRPALKRLISLITAASLLGPSLVGCGDFFQTEMSRGKAQAATYSGGYQVAPVLPGYTYEPPETPDFSQSLTEAYHDPNASIGQVGFGTVGEIPGTSTVNPDGTFQYSVPIRVPEGVRGMSPKLALTYNSRQGDGPLGVGFSLAGLSKIERCKKVLAVEEKIAQVDFKSGHEEGDSYCLDGKKLMLTGGDEGKNGATYRTEVADYAEVKLQVLDNYSKFTIYGADGTVRTFEPQDNLERESWVNATIDPEIPGDGFAPNPKEPRRVLTEGLTWYLTRVSDHYGNAYSVEYQSFSSNGLMTEWLPKAIRYAEGTRTVSFEYQGGAGALQRCLAGVCTAAPPNLAKIEIRLDSQTGRVGPQWEYRLHYQTSVVSGRKQLASLQWCEAGGSCLPGTLFTWQSESYSLRAYRPVWKSLPMAYDIAWQTQVQFADFDGDGRDDLFYNSNTLTANECLRSAGEYDKQKVYLRRAADFYSPIDITSVFKLDNLVVRPHSSRFGDFDNDGAVEILAYNSGLDNSTASYRFAQWDAAAGRLVAAPANSSWNTVSPARSQVDIADANGDGLPDVFIETASKGRRSVRLMIPDGPNEPYLGAELTLLTSEQKATANCQEDRDRHLMDADGDGRYSASCLDDDPAGIPPEKREWNDSVGNSKPAAFGDVNGDGLRDSIRVGDDHDGKQRIEVAFATGRGSRPYQVAFSADLGIMEIDDPSQLQVADFNGDGRADILVEGRGTDPDDLPCGPNQGTRGYGSGNPPIILLSEGETFRVWQDAFSVPGSFDYRFRPDEKFGRYGTAIGDVDGNGVPEILMILWTANGYDELRLHLFEQRDSYQGDALEGHGDQIIRIQNEREAYVADESITYANIAQDDGGETYRPANNCRWPQKCVKSGLSVVKAYRGATSGYRKWTYSYEDGRSDLGGRGFLGFGCVTRQEEESGEVVKTCFNNRERRTKACPGWIYPEAKLPDSVEVRSPVDKDLSKVRVTRADYSYKGPRWMNSAVYTVELWLKTVKTYEGQPTNTDLVHAAQVHNPAHLTSTVTENFVFNSTGSLEQHHETVTANGETIKTETFRRYEDHGFPYYQIGLLKESEVDRERTGANMRKRRTRYTYEARGGMLSRQVQPDTNDGQGLLQTFSLQPNGTLQQSTVRADIGGNQGGGAKTSATVFSYDEDHVHLRRVTNAKGHVAHLGIHPALGLPVVRVDANGIKHELSYDFAGRLRSVDGPDDNDMLIQYGNEDFMKVMNLPGTVYKGTYVSVSHGDREHAVSVLDARGQLQEMYESRGDGGYTTQRWGYDEHLGFLKLTSLPYDSGGSPGGFQKMTHDLLGRQLGVTHPDGTQESWSYPSPFETIHIDPVDRTSITRTDAVGLLKEVVELSATKEVKTKYARHPYGELKSITYPSGSSISFEVDDLGRRTKTVDPDAGVIKTSYNGLGQVVQQIRGGKPNDNDNLYYTTSNQYDELGRLVDTTTTCIQGQSWCRPEHRSFIYDAAEFAVGQLVRAENHTDGVATTFAYDDQSRVKKKEYFLDGDTYAFDYTYDSFSNLIEQKYPQVPGKARFGVERTYDSAGLLSRVFAGSSEYWKTESRDFDGAISNYSQKFNGGQRLYHAFDNDPQTRLLNEVRHFIIPEGEELAIRDGVFYEYYDDGLLKRANRPTVSDDDYTYDYARRLEDWTTAEGDRWTHTYNDDGDLLKVRHQIPMPRSATVDFDNYSYAGTNNAGPHAPTALNEKNYTYDKAGRLTKKTIGSNVQLSVDYTDLDLPYHVSFFDSAGPQSDVSYRYDAFGNRIVETTATSQKVTIGQLYEEEILTPPATLPTVRHFFRVAGESSIVAQETVVEGGGVDRFFVAQDEVGSSSLLVNPDGSVRQKLNFDPWGQRIAVGAQPIPPEDFDIGYTGHQQEDHLGLINMGGRIYDPVLRHVLTPDPLASSVTSNGIHPYAYAMNNPVNFVDPSGFYTYINEDGDRVDEQGHTVTVVAGPFVPTSQTGGGVDLIVWNSGDGGQLGPMSGAGISDGTGTSSGGPIAAIGDTLKNIGLDDVKTALDVGSVFLPGPLAGAAALVGVGISVYQGNYEEAAWGVGGALVAAVGLGIAVKAVRAIRLRNAAAIATKGAATGASSAAQGAKLARQLAAEEIAAGHAFAKHAGQFPGVSTPGQFAKVVEGVMGNATHVRSLSGGRTAFWKDGVVVIRNPGAVDGGTAFVPTNGFQYFQGLR